MQGRVGRRVPNLVGLLAPALAVLLAACGGKVPLPSVPQLQEVGEIGEYGTARLRAADACRRKSAAVDAYMQCMEQGGWAFIERGTGYPSSECWARRVAGDAGDLPPAQCFQRGGGIGVLVTPRAGGGGRRVTRATRTPRHEALRAPRARAARGSRDARSPISAFARSATDLPFRLTIAVLGHDVHHVRAGRGDDVARRERRDDPALAARRAARRWRRGR